MMLKSCRIFPLFLGLLLSLPASGAVVINEIFYHAPDDAEDLEWIELHNPGTDATDLSGWAFTKGIKFKFPAGSRIDANGFLVLCRNRERFIQFYTAEPAGTFDQPLSNKGEKLVLVDTAGKEADAVKYDDKAPWPKGADGYSASLERIHAGSAGDDPFNWAASPLSADGIKPAGTPGKANASRAANLPPIIENVRFSPEHPEPHKPIDVEAAVRDRDGLGEVVILFRTAGPGPETPEGSVAMKPAGTDKLTASIPGQPAGTLVRFRIKAIDRTGAKRIFPAESEPKPALSAYVAPTIEPGKIPFAWVINSGGKGINYEPRRRGFARGGFNPAEQVRRQGQAEQSVELVRSASEPAASPQGKSAFVYVDPVTRKVQVFDFIEFTPRERGGGFKVRLHSDAPLNQMTTLNLLFEYNERFVLAEHLAYEVYRKAGHAACQSDFVRLHVDGQPVGYHVLVEQPNRAFLRRNKLNDDGNLYKILWYGTGVVGQHEKKTNQRSDHADVIALVNALNKTEGAEQWELIQKNFDVKQVATYFAVNMVLSHWDGYFNNYFTYHDTKTGKWSMYPWDQDKTWGFHDGLGEGQVFFDMPLTFGMAGDAPPGSKPGTRPRGFGFFGGGGAMWWRPGGYFSSPLLANAEFRKVFLKRTRELLDEVYTEEVFNPVIDSVNERLRDEVRFRAELQSENPDRALERFDRNIKSLREHISKRREFLLAQPELKELPK